MPRTGRLPVALLAAAVIGGIVAFVVFLAAVRRSEKSELRRLASAVGPHRLIRPRLTGGFAYAPCADLAPNDSVVAGLVCDGPPPRQWTESRQLSKVAVAMRGSGHRDVQSGRRHADAVWHVIWDDAAAAVDELRAASELEPLDAGIQSDLAAALLARAERAQDARLILDALRAADSAIALDPRLAEARFNRALILEQLSIRRRAIEAWTAYLQVDGSSPWADEARSRLTKLRTPPANWSVAERRLQVGIAAKDSAIVHDITRQFSVRVRDAAVASIIAWAHAYQASEPKSDTLLQRAAVLARAVESVTGEALPLDVAAAIERATSDGDRLRLQEIARGLRGYERGHRFLADFNLDSARVWIAEASRGLAAGRSAATYWVAYDSAEISYQAAGTRGYDRALLSLGQILAVAPPSYHTVRGLAARMQGLIHAIRADYDAAISAYQAAAIEGRGTGDPALELRPRGVLAALYAELRGDGEAWRELFSAFHSLGGDGEMPGEAQRLFVMATQLSWRHYPSAAVLFQEEAVRLARVVDSGATMTVSALAQQAELLARAGMVERALESLRQARAATDSIAADSIRAIKVADVDLAEGAVLLRVRPESAAVVLRRAVERYGATQYLLEVNRAHLLLANAYAASGKMDSAQRAFEAALSETERRRAGILDSDDRMRFLDQARPVVDRVVRFYVEQADTLASLEFFEQMRSRVLLERVDARRRSDDVRVGRIDRLRATLSPTTAVISYAVLDTELVAWAIGRDDVRMHRIPLRTPLGPLVERFSKSIEGRRADDVRSISTQLYNILIAPVAADVKHATRLVLVPDKAINSVPFAALFDSVAGRFLVENFELDIAPSVELFRRSAARYAVFGKQTARVLVVGNPTFDRATFALPLLPGAEREAVRVAEEYAGAQLLVGATATKGMFLREAARADVVHFAGHGVINGDLPLRSYLVLARDPNDGSSGALYARELFSASLPRTRLAILSGCQTASGQLSETEGPSSLARALFAAGVPAVIASLWAVDDERTATFFASYHRELSRGIDPVTALRHIQLQWISQPREAWGSLSTWAAFELFGATSPDAAPNLQP